MQRYAYVPFSQLNHEGRLSDDIIHFVTKKNIFAFNEETDIQDNHHWHLKIIREKNILDSLEESLVEVIGLEFFRLFLPHQPEVRLCPDIMDNNKIYAGILFKGIGSLKAVKSPISIGILNKTFASPNLMKIITFAKLFRDFNLSWNNIATDKNNNVVYANGSHLLTDHLLELSINEINAIPYIHDDQLLLPANWLNQISFSSDSNTISTRFTYRELVKNGFYDKEEVIKSREEVNHALLMFMILPNEVIALFTEIYLSLDEDLLNKLNINPNLQSLKNSIFKMLTERKIELKEIIKNHLDFLTYLHHSNSQKQLDDIILQFKEFKMAGQKNLGEFIPNLELNIRDEFSTLKKYCTNNENKKNAIVTNLPDYSIFKMNNNNNSEVSQLDNKIFN